MCSWSILTYFSYLIPFNGVYRYPVMIYIYNLKLPSRLENLPAYPTVVSSNPLRSGSCFLRYFNGRFMVSSSSLVCVVNCCFVDGVTPCVARTLFFALGSSITIGCEFSIKQVSIPVAFVWILTVYYFFHCLLFRQFSFPWTVPFQYYFTTFHILLNSA